MKSSKVNKELREKISDPKKVGPGIWYLIHSRSLKTVTMAQKQAYAQFVQETVTDIRCEDCKGHALKYIQNNPMHPYFNVKDVKTGAEIGCFKWSFLFHNDVNRRLGKHELDFDTAFMLYANAEACKECTKNSQGSKGYKIIEKKSH